MPNRGKCPDELRERAVRLVLDHEHEYGSQWEAICSVAEKLGPKAETVRKWVRQAEVDHRLLGSAVATIRLRSCGTFMWDSPIRTEPPSGRFARYSA